jgi:hypothetical protein
MDIIEAVEAIRAHVHPQKKAAAECGYSSAHFCQLINAVMRGERINRKAERIIVGYAKELPPYIPQADDTECSA